MSTHKMTIDNANKGLQNNHDNTILSNKSCDNKINADKHCTEIIPYLFAHFHNIFVIKH